MASILSGSATAKAYCGVRLESTSDSWAGVCFAAKAAHGFEGAFEALTDEGSRLCRGMVTGSPVSALSPARGCCVAVKGGQAARVSGSGARAFVRAWPRTLRPLATYSTLNHAGNLIHQLSVNAPSG